MPTFAVRQRWKSPWTALAAWRRRKAKPGRPAPVDVREAYCATWPSAAPDESQFASSPAERPTGPADRLAGRNLPAFASEQDLHRIRGVARRLADVDEHAIGILENLTNYVIGTGLVYTVSAKGRPPAALEGDDASPAGRLAQAARQVLEDLFLRRQWSGELERELFRRAHRDGEFFLWLAPEKAGRARVRIVEPEWVTEPADPRRLEQWLGEARLDWSLGVAAEAGDAARVHGYFVEWPAEQQGGESCSYIPARQMVHCRLNVDRNVKRGLSDFYAVWETLQRADRLLGNTLQGAAVRAAIAYITEHAPGAGGAQIQNLTATLSDASFAARTSSGVRTVRVNQREAGTRLDVEHGRTFHAGMQGTPEGPSHVQVLQAALRRIGARWCMPEYMISGDASNANYSSTLVAESPFVKAAEAQQALFRDCFREAIWKVLGIAAQAGRLPVGVGGLQWQLALTAECPSVAVRNRGEELAIRQALFNSGLLSKRTWCEQAGLDFDREQARRRAESAGG